MYLQIVHYLETSGIVASIQRLPVFNLHMMIELPTIWLSFGFCKLNQNGDTTGQVTFNDFLKVPFTLGTYYLVCKLVDSFIRDIVTQITVLI